MAVGSVNTIQVLYIAFRLAPFIIVAYFALNSLMNFTIRGIMYLIGLLILTFFTVVISGVTPDAELPVGIAGDPNARSTCNIITLSGDMKNPLSKIPLSITIYSYTLSYILTTVLLHLKKSQGEKLPLSNIPTIVLFCLLILVEFFFSINAYCFSALQGFMALVLGMLGGMAWGALIYYRGSPDMTFYSTSSDICTRPSNLKYQCKKST